MFQYQHLKGKYDKISYFAMKFHFESFKFIELSIKFLLWNLNFNFPLKLRLVQGCYMYYVINTTCNLKNYEIPTDQICNIGKGRERRKCNQLGKSAP